MSITVESVHYTPATGWTYITRTTERSGRVTEVVEGPYPDRAGLRAGVAPAKRGHVDACAQPSYTPPGRR